MLLKFKLDKDGFTFTNPADLIAAESIDYIKCHFDITDTVWKETDAIIAVFKSATYNKHSEVLLDSYNNCYIDPEVYKRGGRIQVKLVGDKYLNDTVISSTTITSVLEFNINENIIVPLESPSKYSIAIAELEKAKSSVDEALTDLAYKLAHGELNGVGIERVVYNLDGTVTITLSDGTVFTSEYSMKGATGNSGVYYGPDEPTDPDIFVWVNPDGEPTFDPLYEIIDTWMEAHPEATTTVQDNSLSLNKLNADLKSSVIPKLTDFGTASVSLINTLLNTGIPFLRLTGEIVSDTPIIINHPVTLVCDDFTLHQTVWGNPSIIVLSDNVNILGNITLICDVATRNPVTNPYYETDTSDPKSNSTGIMLGHHGEYANFYAEHISVKNFIAGVTNLSIGYKNINIDYLYVENVDFGVFGAHYISTHIKCVEFKDIASYVGSADPSHAIYLTGGSDVGLSEDFNVDYIMGDGCKSKSSDTVIGVKSTINFACKGGHVKNIAGLAYAITATGYIENITVENSTAGISTQLINTDFVYRNLNFKRIDVNGEYINYFTGNSKAKVIDCIFTVNTDDSNYAYVYVSDTEYYEKDCIYISPTDSNTQIYGRSGGSNTKFYVYNPTMSIRICDDGFLSITDAYVLLDPAKLNYPKTNSLVPNPHFIENNYVADEADSINYPLGFRTNDKVRVTNADVRYFNNNNATNGVVYTLINGGGSAITNGTRLKTKTGENYLSTDWTIFRFMNIGNVAYEV